MTPRLLLAAVGALLAAFLVAGCGSSDEAIPSGDAEALKGELQVLEQQVEDASCDEADSTLTSLFMSAEELPGGETKKGVLDLLDELEILTGEKCSEQEPTESTSTTTTSTTEAPTTTSEPTTETTTTEDPTTETTTTTTQTETTPPSNGGDGGGGGGTGGTSPGGGSEGDE